MRITRVDACDLEYDPPVLMQERLETLLIRQAAHFDSPMIHTMIRPYRKKITAYRYPRRFIAYNRGIQGVA